MNSERLVSLLNEIEPQRIAIIKPSALGDVVQTLPLINVLRSRFPGASIDWVIRSELASLLSTVNGLEDVVPYYRHGGWKAWATLLHTLRRKRYDLVFDLQGLLRTGVMTAATGANLRIGLQTARECSHLACHGLLPNTEKTVPAHTRYWRLAELLNAERTSRQLELTFSAEDQAAATRLVGTGERPYLVIHPGAMWETKRWPPASFAEVALRVIETYGMPVVVIGAKAETAMADFICEAIEQIRPSAKLFNLAGRTTLPELAIVLQRASLVLSNDSGPMHLAAGLGTPVVGIFTCTSATRSGPAGTMHELIEAKVPCAASYRKKCPFTGGAHLQCMQAVSLHQTWSAVQKAVQKNSIASRVA